MTASLSITTGFAAPIAEPNNQRGTTVVRALDDHLRDNSPPAHYIEGATMIMLGADDTCR